VSLDENVWAQIIRQLVLCLSSAEDIQTLGLYSTKRKHSEVTASKLLSLMLYQNNDNELGSYETFALFHSTSNTAGFSEQSFSCDWSLKESDSYSKEFLLSLIEEKRSQDLSHLINNSCQRLECTTKILSSSLTKMTPAFLLK
jgi:hypothetical protein